ncbi:sulfotransferase family protein [Parapedomonas caeni]
MYSDYNTLNVDVARFWPTPDRHEELAQALDPDLLLQQARDQTGLRDFGDDHFLEPYRMLLDSVARDVDFSDQGLRTFRYNVLRCLVNRLRITRDFRQHPEILDEDVDDPIVVIGLPRSGTTKVHRMLAALPRDVIQTPLLWQMMNPAPFPDARPDQPDPRIAAARLGGMTSDERPDYAAAHLVTAQEPEEDVLLCDSTFDDWVWSSVFAPSRRYYDWVIERPHLGNYQHLKRMFQYLQWQDGGRRGRPWITKNVQHIAYLDELLTCFPRATLVHCHRTPHDSIPSLARLTEILWSSIVREVDPVFTGQAIFRWWRTAMDRYMATRQRLHLDDRIIDVPYDRIRRDGLGLVEEIYRRAGRPLTPALLDYPRQWERDNEQHKNGHHAYSLARFGLDAAQIDQGFGDYIRRFIA